MKLSGLYLQIGVVPNYVADIIILRLYLAFVFALKLEFECQN